MSQMRLSSACGQYEGRSRVQKLNRVTHDTWIKTFYDLYLFPPIVLTREHPRAHTNSILQKHFPDANLHRVSAVPDASEQGFGCYVGFIRK